MGGANVFQKEKETEKEMEKEKEMEEETSIPGGYYEIPWSNG